MAGIIVSGDTSGAVTLSAPAVAGTVTVTLPATSGTMATLTTPSFATTIGVGAATASASGAGITFPATQSASSDANTLDDYEEGTWTPVLTRTGSSYTFNGQGGVYTKIGNVVTVQFSCDITAIGTQGTGYNSISGLPFAPFVYAGAGRSTAALSFNSVLTSATAMYYASNWFFTDGTNALQTNFTTGSFSGSITYTV